MKKQGKPEGPNAGPKKRPYRAPSISEESVFDRKLVLQCDKAEPCDDGFSTVTS